MKFTKTKVFEWKYKMLNIKCPQLKKIHVYRQSFNKKDLHFLIIEQNWKKKSCDKRTKEVNSLSLWCLYLHLTFGSVTTHSTSHLSHFLTLCFLHTVLSPPVTLTEGAESSHICVASLIGASGRVVFYSLNTFSIEPSDLINWGLHFILYYLLY